MEYSYVQLLSDEMEFLRGVRKAIAEGKPAWRQAPVKISWPAFVNRYLEGVRLRTRGFLKDDMSWVERQQLTFKVLSLIKGGE